MASGDTLATLLPYGALPVDSANADRDIVNDGSTIASWIPVIAYAGATADEHAEWEFVMPSNYGGGGLDFAIEYAMGGTVGTDVQFEVRAKAAAASVTLTSHNIQAQTLTDITDTPNGTANVTDITPTGSITHANAGSPAVGNLVRVRVSRDFNHATNGDDAKVLAIHVTET